MESSDFYYKYLAPDLFKKVFEKNLVKLRITQPSDLNDPFEILPVLSNENEAKTIFEKSLYGATKLFKTTEQYNTEFEKWKSANNFRISWNNIEAKKHLDFLDNIIGTVSFSGSWKNVLLWSYYAKDHKGFCLGFDSKSPNFIPKINEGLVKRVDYNNDRIKLPDIFINESIFHRSKLLKLFFTKSRKWIAEDEYRLVYFLETFEPEKDHFSPSQLPIYLKKFPHDTLKEINIGPRASLELKSNLLEYGNLLGANVYQCYPHPAQYDMDRVLIS